MCDCANKLLESVGLYMKAGIMKAAMEKPRAIKIKKPKMKKVKACKK